MRCFFAIQVIIAAALCSGAVSADCVAFEPDPQLVKAVSYNIREAPYDPSSPVLWTVDLLLAEEQTNGDYIAWAIASVTISEFDTEGALLHVWSDDWPDPNTPDGLWWIEHANPQNPVLAEFAEPPWVEGLAAAEDPADIDMLYYIEGLHYDPPPEGSPFETTSELNYTFTLDGEPTPQSEGEGMLLEVLPTDGPPAG